MNKKLFKNEQGFMHVLLAIIVVVIIAALGFVAWRELSNNKKSSSNVTSRVSSNSNKTTAATMVAQTACLSQYHDSDLCAFVAAEAATPFEKTAAKIVITGTSNGAANNITLEQDGKGNESFSSTGNGQTINTVVLNGQAYTQEASGGSWITYSSADTSASTPPDSSLSNFTNSVSTMNYTKIDTEACGNLTCFKYQIKDATDPSLTQYAWFDTTNHLLRQFYESDPSSGDQTTMAIAYQAISISKPSPIQDLSAQMGQ